MNKPLLTICLISYNQAQYIREAIESILMQKVNFSWELVIADDYSTDETREIILEYEKKYPSLIHLILQEKNVGPEKNWLDLMSYPKSKYVLYAEGDDYFTDPNKLQMQVDFLEKNPDFSLCFHPVKVIFEDDSQPDSIFPTKEYIFNKEVLTLEDLLKHNFIQTNSAMYRWRFVEENILDIFPKNIIPGDYFLHLLHAQKGKIGFIDKVMAVYRRHPGGIWFYPSEKANDLYLKHGIQQLNFFKNVYETFLNKSDEYLKNKILPFAMHIVNLFLINKRFNKLEKFANTFPEYYDIFNAEHNPKLIRQMRREIQKKNQEIKVMKSSKLWKMREYYLKILDQFIKFKNFGKRCSPHRIKVSWYKIFSIISGKPIEYDFVDYGSKSGGSMALAMKKFGGKRGLGIEIRPEMVDMAKKLGYDVMLGDVTKLSLSDKIVRFTMISHFLEHLPDIKSVELAIINAIRISREFVYIRGPIFDDEEYLKDLGLKVYWSDWPGGHTCHLTTKQLAKILDSLKVKSYKIDFEVEIEDSMNSNIHPIESPHSQHEYIPSQHPPKKFIKFDKKLYREFVCIVRV